MLFCSIIGVLQFLALPSNQMEPKVAKGYQASIRHHPYSVFIMLSENQYAHVCGASVINQKILLTAGHCFDDLFSASFATAHVGHRDRRRGDVIYITRVKVHPRYDSRKIVNDIALAGLEHELKFSDIIKRVALAESHPPKDAVASLAGWGLVNEDPATATYVLHSTDQKVWAYKDCMRFLRKIPDGTFCGGKHSHGGYASVGDSGSPLVVDNYLQIGVVSFKKVHISSSVVIYTDVAYFYHWIAENAGSVFCG